MNAIPRLKVYQGPALLSYGFRPFFFLGACQAALGIALWLPLFEGEFTLPSMFAPRDWHIHEMLFGYLAAVVTGFLLTAIPSWTGRLPLRGTSLLGLVIVWLAGRVAVFLSMHLGWMVAAVVDSTFLLLVVAACCARNRRRAELAESACSCSGDRACARQYRLSPRSACIQCFHFREPHWYWGNANPDHADRGPGHSEFYAQLAGARKSRPVAHPFWTV